MVMVQKIAPILGQGLDFKKDRKRIKISEAVRKLNQ